MSIKLVREELNKFLTRKGPEVLCLRGRWGVGKSFAWKIALEEAQKNNLIEFPRYSYVSLFGVNSLDELKFAVFENVITLSNGVVRANLETLDDFVSSKVGSWRKITRLAQSVPIVRSFVGGDATGLVSFMTIRDQIVCIDDLERRGSKLEMRDVLGLVSYLREQRDCKIVIILNDEKLDPEAAKAFGSNLEKVVDLSFAYEPTPDESSDIAITNKDATGIMIAERCQSLVITNIRVIRRIDKVVRDLEPILSGFDPQVFKTAAASVILFVWANDQPEEAPPLDFIKNKKKNLFGIEDVSQEEAAWSAFLEAYGYWWSDELDVELMRATQAGFFNPDVIKKLAAAANERVLAERGDGSFDLAWRAYHDSFANNDEIVLDDLHAAFMKGAKSITPINLSGTITLFKDLGRFDQAKEMLEHYMAVRHEDREFYDLDDSGFGAEVKDPDVRAAFKARFDSLEEKRDVKSMLLKLKHGWDDEMITSLASLPVEEYRKVLKSAEGEQLRTILSGALQFDTIVNASDEMRKISSRTREALEQIGAESPINKRRVQRYGIKYDTSAPGS